MTAVVALGGNALMRPGQRGTAAEQRANLHEACAALRPLLAETALVITHGNGPQVGNELLRHERAADEAPPLPLYLAVAQTQAEIGALIESELEPVAGRPVACLLTHVRVAEDDPAFDEPTKPVGPFYEEARARELERDRGWNVVHDAGRGWRRVVPSPAPLEVIELTALRALLGSGVIAIACGGGGIPVARRGARLAGIDAVIDKDRASALLARELSADRLVRRRVDQAEGRGERRLRQGDRARGADHIRRGPRRGAGRPCRHQNSPGMSTSEVASEERWLNRGVVGIGGASLRGDLGYEIPTALLPSFLTSTLGAPAVALGLIEGIADGLGGAARLAGGALADDPGSRRATAIGGYTATAVLSALIGAAGAAWQVGVLRSGAWVARGLRGPARDAPRRRACPAATRSTGGGRVRRRGAPLPSCECGVRVHRSEPRRTGDLLRAGRCRQGLRRDGPGLGRARPERRRRPRRPPSLG